MAALQTYQIPAIGGLDLASPPQVLAQKPGAAIELNNFESLPQGGYRRINGYVTYGDIPDVINLMDIRGLAYYKGIVAVVGDRILHSPNGASWFTVNRDNCSKVASNSLPPLTIKPRTGKGPVNFATLTVGTTEVLVITDDAGTPAQLTVEGDLYTYSESDNADVSGYRYCTKYQDHVVYASSLGKPGSIAVSDRFNPLGFTGAGSWEAQVVDEIVGIHSFRDYLYIFCRSSIYRVVNLESAKDIAIRPVTTKVGCIDGRSIQEIGGDILFLSDDGLRYLGATERIDDVAINLVSDLVRPLISKVSPTLGPISSIVIPSKSQYRIFFTDSLGKRKGLIGVLKGDGQFEWSTTDDLLVEAITLNTTGENEQAYHIGSPTTGSKRVYFHDKGNKFDGTPIRASWKVPAFNMGDSAIRKTMHFIDVYLEAEDKAAIEMNIIYDHDSPKVMQPEPFYLEPVVDAARWGQVRWGEFEWGATRYPLEDIFLEGSGMWIQFMFNDNDDDNSSYIIRGYDLQFTTAGRI